MPLRPSRRVTIALLTLIAAVGGVVVLTYSDPLLTRWMPQCPVKWLTGYDCPGCGTLRAIHALLHGDLRRAVCFNPLPFLLIPYLIALTYALYFDRRGRWSVLYSAKTCMGLAIIIILYGIIRNFF